MIDFGELPTGSPTPNSYRIAHATAEPGGVRELAIRAGGQFYEHPPIGSLEGQSPFAWFAAKHDWILRLDADEFPDDPLKDWLRRFRESPEPSPDISGYTCVWPLWDGEKTASKGWPTGRVFLFHRRRVRFFGLVEQVPIPEHRFEPLDLVLHHQPTRKSFGLGNIVLRPQAYRWRRSIAESLVGKPTDLSRWRWRSDAWPAVWEEIRLHPLRTAFYRLLIWPLFDIRNQWRKHRAIRLSALLSGPVHHFLICLDHWWCRRRSRKATTTREG